ncbi:MAG: 50S ribosomal protein L32 [Bacteroidetes bacterium]|nr:50S ribosomal protein L32 [Bacteroidota bacterium]MBL7891358.1 50S ribosomal protein L32 [Bacteroidia bacterium]
MPNPKRRHSKARTRSRRAHFKAHGSALTTCPTTGEVHLTHRAYWHDGKLYYKGKVVMEKAAA